MAYDESYGISGRLMLFVKMWQNTSYDDSFHLDNRSMNELNCFSASANGYSLRQLVNKQDLKVFIDQIKQYPENSKFIIEIYQFLYGKEFLSQFIPN